MIYILVLVLVLSFISEKTHLCHFINRDHPSDSHNGFVNCNPGLVNRG